MSGWIATSQVLHHQSITSQGTSVVTAKGIGVRQSIGQQSAAGTVNYQHYVVQQGFQQSLLSTPNSKKVIIPTIEIKVYPNPFSSVINFDFTTEIKGEIEVKIVDNLGRLVYNSKGIPQQNRLTISNLTHLADGSYFVTLLGSNFQYSTHLIQSK